MINIKCVVSNAGYQWIWIGEVTIDGGWIHISRAVNVRRWTDGFGSVHKDPSKCTIDAAFAGVTMAVGAAIQIHDVDATKWAPVLDKHHA